MQPKTLPTLTGLKHFFVLITLLFFSSNIGFSQSANDNCANAISIPVGTSCANTSFTFTSNTTQTGAANPALCNGVNANRDGWYTFTTDATTTSITLEGETNRPWSVSIYSGNCSGFALVDCDNAANNTPITLNTSVSPNTTYYVRINRTNVNTNAWSGNVCVYKPAAASYCTPTNTYSTSYYISGVSTTGGVTNINNTGTGFSAYTNYTGFSVSQYPGSSFTLNATHPSSTYGYNVWVDWNDDGDFDDAGENVISTGYLNSPANLGVVNIPGGQAAGNYRMRIRNAYLSNPAPACGSHDYGEAEDYTVTVIAPSACSGTPTAGTTTTSPTSGAPGSSYTVSATGFTNASGLTYQWQYSTDGGSTWNNQGTATSAYSNYTATAPASGDVHWQLAVTCANSGLTGTSTIGVFVTMAVSVVETGCPNVVSGGLGLSGADPAPFNCTDTSTCVDLEATYLDLGETTNYIVEPIAYNPPFSFTGLANPIVLGTDDYWSDEIVNLPFDFCFFGYTYDQVLPGPNGAITFDTSLVGDYAGYSFSNNLPSTTGALFNNTIYGVYHDINSTYGGQFGWELVTLPSGCRALVVAYNDVPMFSENAILYSGMIVLYENSNIIEVYVKEKRIDDYNSSPWNGGNAIIGLQNSDGTIAVVPPGRNSLDTNWEAVGEAWRFVPNGTSIASLTWYEGSGTSGPVLGTTDVINVCPTATTTYTAEITYTLCDGRTITELDETTVTVNGAKVWNGSVDTDWDKANNWTPVGIPTAMDCVVIPDTANDPIISGSGYNGLGLNMSIQNDAMLTVNSNNSVTITDWVNISTTGELFLDNAASLVQVNNIANSGAGIMRMERDVNIKRLDYVYWSSPVTSFLSSAISPGSPTSLIWKWTPTVPGKGIGNSGDWVNGNETMTLGKGYIVRGPSSYTTTPQNFTATFVGTPNNGNISLPIYRGTYTSAATYQVCATCTPATALDDNWNLVGNPYPSAIRAIDFLTANTSIDGNIKIWTHGTLPSSAYVDPFYNGYVYNYTIGDYITYNSLGSSSGPGVFNGFIGAGQGFFVSMLDSAATPGNVNFNNSLRSSTYNNSQFFRTNTEEQHRIWLDIINVTSNASTRALVGYTDGATQSRDRLFDAVTDTKMTLNLYSLIDDERFSIQGRQTPFDDTDRIPLGYKVPSSGNYSIALSALDGLFSDTNQNIYLEDLENNVTHDLRVSPYQFTSNVGVFDNRFVLKFLNNTLENNDFDNIENTVWVSSGNELLVNSSIENISSIKVFDILGRVLSNKEKVTSKTIVLDQILKTNSGLILEITLENGKTIYKKTVY